MRSPRGTDPAQSEQKRLLVLVLDRGETGEHFARFGNGIQGHAIAQSREFLPHRPHVSILVCGIDGIVRFPFRYFDNGSIARPHDRRLPIGYQSFLAQSRHAAADELQQFYFLTRLRSISNDDANSWHAIDLTQGSRVGHEKRHRTGDDSASLRAGQVNRFC